MERADDSISIPRKRLAGVCGLFCPACHVFIGTKEDQKRLDVMAKRVQRTVEELRCNGCRSHQRCYYCESSCKMTKCAAEKRIDFCCECAEYPCEELKAFQAEMPHRIELWESQKRIRGAGYEQWYKEMIGHYSCPTCRTLNSAYDLKCRKCGEEPSCAYVGRHRQAIRQYFKKR